MEIVRYESKYRQAFIDLNMKKKKKYFTPEEADFAMLYGIDGIIEKGGMAFFAVDESGEAVSTCLIMPYKEDSWEICKFATDERCQGRGIGSAVLRAAIGYATERGAKKLVILSNTILESAINLYRKFGFKEVPVDDMQYKRVNIQLERDLRE